MASYDAVVNFIVSGGSKIDQIINKAAQLESIIDSIKKTPLEVNVQKAISQFDTLDANLKAAKATLANQQKAADQAANSIGSYTDKIAALGKQLSTLTPNTKKYNEVLERQNKATKDRAAAEKSANDALEKVAKTELQISGLRKETGRAKATKEATIAIDQLADNYLRLGAAQQKANAKSTLASLAAQAEALKLVASNSDIASSQFNRFAIATQLASQKIFEGRQKQLGALAFGLSAEAPGVNIGTGGKSSIAASRDLVQSAIGSYGQIVKSEAALSNYAERLRSLQSLVPYTSNEFRALEEALAGVNAELAGIGRRGQKSQIQSLAGPATNLGSLKAFQQRASFEKRVNDELERQAAIETRIQQANLNEFQKKQLSAQLDEAAAALAESRLEDAQRLTRELDRQRQSMERMNRAQGSQGFGQLFGVLGTSFLPVTGKMPGGGLVPGSPAAQAEIDKNQRAAAARALEQEGKSFKDLIKYTNEAANAAEKLGNMQDRAFLVEGLDSYLSDLASVESATQKILDSSKSAGRSFDKILKDRIQFKRNEDQILAKQTGPSLGLDAPRRLQSTLASGAIVEQSLVNLLNKGADVSNELIALQNSLNAAKQKGYVITENNLNALIDEVALAGKFAQLQRTIFAGQSKGGRGAGAAGSGLEQALKSLEEARGAGKAFFGGASPEEAIDKIVRGFKTDASIGENITSTFAQDIKNGAGRMIAAATQSFEGVKEAIKKAFGISSPSKFMIELVQNLANTYVSEMQKAYPRIQAATEKAFGEQTLLRDVKKLRATGKGFEFIGQQSTGFKPFPMGAETKGMTQEFNHMMLDFRKKIAELTTQPEIYQNLLNALPNSRITTDLVGVANRRAAASEIPSFMSTQRMLGPGELERFITAQLAGYLRDIKVPNPWVGAIGDYKQFIAKVIAETDRLRLSSATISQKLLPEGRVAGLLPAGQDIENSKFEDRIRQAFERSAQRSADLFAEDALRRFNQGLAGLGGGGGRFLPPDGPFGGGGGGGGGGNIPPNQPPINQLLLGLDALGDVSRFSTRELEALSGVLGELRATLDPTIENFDRLDRQLRETIGGISRQLERRDPNADFLTRRLEPRTGRAVSEGLIGGAFPLLFGQGAGAAAGGLAGGVAGGFAGGGLGFGLSLVGTALGTAFDTAVQSATELGAALVDTSKTFDLVKDRSLFSSKETEKLATRLSEMGLAASASILAQQEIINKVGATGYGSLTDLASASDKAARAWSEFNLQLQAALAGPMAGLLEWVASILALQNQSARSQQFVKDVSSGLGGPIKEEFDREARIISGREAQGSTIFGTLFGGISKEDATKQRNELAQAYADFAVPVKIEPKLTDKQKIEQELAMLGKNLEAIDIGKSLKDAARQAAREQQDLDKQRADLVRSYEESIADIRKRVEDEIARRRFSILEKENQLLDAQGENRIKQLQAANAQEVALAGRGERSEVASVAQEVAQIVADFTEQQLSAEEEAAKIKRDAALDARKFDFESGQFKANIEKEVAKLNINTARQVASINEGVRRRNEETDSRRFNIQKNISALQLKNIETELKLGARAPGLSPEIRRNTEIMALIVGQQIEDIEKMQPPAKLREVAQVGGAGVSTTNFDAIVAKESGAIQALVDEALKGINLTAEQAGVTATQRLQVVTDGIDQSLEEIQTREADLEATRLRRIELVNAGLTESVAQRVIELEQAKRIALAQYDIAIAQLESKINTTDATAQVARQNALYQQQIELIRQRKDALEGRFGAFDETTGAGTGAIGETVTSQAGNEIQEFITKSVAELNNLEAVAVSVSQSIGNAVGNSLANGIAGLIEGTATAKEVFAGFLKDVGQILVQEGTRMIAMYIAIGIARMFAGIASSAGKTPLPGSSPQMTPGAVVTPTGFEGQFANLAAKGATFSNGIAKFASGGIVSSPTLFKFADGGATRTGLMGEAGPEAIMPLKRGPDGSLGVQANGLRDAMGAAPGSPTGSPVLNMSFETTRFGDAEYVSRDQLEQAMATTRRQATRDGAKRGMTMTLDRIQQSPQTRSRIGVRR